MTTSKTDFFRELHKLSPEQSMDETLTIARWNYSAQQLRRQCKLYNGDSFEDRQRRYVLLMRFTMLVLKTIPKHPRYNDPNQIKEKQELRQECNKALDEIDQLKRLLEKDLEQQQRQIDEAQSQIAKQQREKEEMVKMYNTKAAAEAGKAWEAPVPEPASSSSATATDYSSKDAYRSWNSNSVPLSEQVRQMQISRATSGTGTSDNVSTMGGSGGMNSATVNTNVTTNVSNVNIHHTSSTVASTHSTIPVGKPSLSSTITTTKAPPSSSPSSLAQPPATIPTAIAISANKMNIFDQGLRPVILPGEIMDEFMKMANANTMNAIETCGVLAGTIEGNTLIISCVIVPRQSGTTDSCQTMDEESLFFELDSRNLLSLGWIHTHPTQTAFLSSVDLHMHACYQSMLQEAIAVVMSPTHQPTHGIFRLTEPEGINLIQTCRLNGFHPHPSVSPLFQTCKHVQVVWGKFRPVAVDMRPPPLYSL